MGLLELYVSLQFRWQIYGKIDTLTALFKLKKVKEAEFECREEAGEGLEVWDLMFEIWK